MVGNSWGGVSISTGKDLLKKTLPNISGMVWGNLFRTEKLKHIMFPVGQMYEDSWCYPLYLLASDIVVTYPRCTYNYYEVATSVVHTEYGKSKKAVNHFLIYYEHLMKVYSEVGLTKLSTESKWYYITKYMSFYVANDRKNEYYAHFRKYLLEWILGAGTTLRGRLSAVKQYLKWKIKKS